MISKVAPRPGSSPINTTAMLICGGGVAECWVGSGKCGGGGCERGLLAVMLIVILKQTLVMSISEVRRYALNGIKCLGL